MLLLMLACTKQIHPGSVNQFDSATYDGMLVYQSVLDEAKVQFLEGKLPVSSKIVINKAGETYNLLRDAWLAYRASQNPDTLAKVQALVVQMDALVADLNKLLKKEEESYVERTVHDRTGRAEHRQQQG
jgi:hypothetical protein